MAEGEDTSGRRDALLELRDVTKTFEAPGGGARRVVLDGLSLQVRRGTSVAVVGPSGSGKSTLLHLIAALDRPDSGSVRLDGRDVSRADARELARIRNRELGIVFQAHHLLPQCSALENALVPALVAGRAERRAAKERATRLLDRVGLAQRMHHRPAELSGGECQRVAVVRALVNRPKLLLADEPTGSLDRRSSDELADLLAELNREEALTMLVVTHSQRLAAAMQRVLELVDGRLAEAAAAP